MLPAIKRGSRSSRVDDAYSVRAGFYEAEIVGPILGVHLLLHLVSASAADNTPCLLAVQNRRPHPAHYLVAKLLHSPQGASSRDQTHVTVDTRTPRPRRKRTCGLRGQESGAGPQQRACVVPFQKCCICIAPVHSCASLIFDYFRRTAGYFSSLDPKTSAPWTGTCPSIALAPSIIFA